MTIERAVTGGTLTNAVDRIGEVFAIFDSRTQDSGHISYGVRDGSGRRWFVKTPGVDTLSPGGASRTERSQALVLSAEVSTAIRHAALIPVERIVETDEGMLTVSAWFDGELVRAPAELRDDPAHAFNRFRSLPTSEIVAALDSVIDLHVDLAAAGWVAGDFYDGCLMYDFAAGVIKVMDFECYHRGPYLNSTGTLPGSTRFMAPEESTRGAVIDERTTVFNLGRMIQVLLLDRNPDHPTREVACAATRSNPTDRPGSVAGLLGAWRSISPDR